MLKPVAILTLVLCGTLFAQEDPSTLRDQGLTLLKEAQTSPDKIVDAEKFLPIEVPHA